MQIISLSSTKADEAIYTAIQTLSSGGLVIYPTETTYGIGADATNQKAVDKLLQYKKRREGKPLSIAVANKNTAGAYVELNPTALNIYKNFLPGPVTVVSRGKHKVAFGVESEAGTLGVRISSHPFVQMLTKVFKKPITATGANASYKKRPYTIDDILNNISEKQKQLIDLVIDAGELPHNEPSTVIDTTMDDVSVLRQGLIIFTENNKVTTHNAEETQELGKKMILKYKSLLSYKAVIFCLQGEMGAGKTQFSKGIAQGLGIHRIVSSPTFILSRAYPFEAEGKQLEFMHIDTWRMAEEKELEDLGFVDMIDRCSVICIEWADKVKPLIEAVKDEAKIIWVDIQVSKEHEDERYVHISD